MGDLRAALAGTGTAVLTAEPGAGKTTVVPLRLLDEPWLAGRRIVILEPRRVATRAAARRMASLLGEDVGDTVGFRTRDERRVGPSTRIEVVTEGILTRWLQSDPELPAIALVVFDEFHERNLQADLGLALTLDVRGSVRPDLRLLVMSATIDVDRVAARLGGAPVVRSEGRTHPVDIRWLPKGKHDRVETAVAAAVARALREEHGDVLAFVPGAAEIRRVVDALADAPAEVRPLYGGLPAADQDAALVPSPHGFPRVVVATDIAETSLTVEGVRVVVDAGLARVPRFDPRTGMTRLQTITASKASADQRAGRAGRVEPGVAYRLWSKLEHAARRPFLEPEITQVDLAGLALELAAWGAGATSLPFLDPPPRRALDEAHALLADLGAVDGDGRITDAGRRMATLPLHPRLAHMVAAAAPPDGWLACMLAALLEDRDVLRGRPDDVPTDVAERLRLIADPSARHPAADGRAIAGARSRAADIARRAGIDASGADGDRAGRVLALAYPDRLAQRRDVNPTGRFKLRSGAGAWMPVTDQLAREEFLVAADLDGHRKDARVRLAAAVDATDVLSLFGHRVEEHASLVWDRERDDLVARVERTLGQLRLGVVERRPDPGPATERVVRERLKSTRLGALSWTPAATDLRGRLAFLHRHAGAPWPDVSDAALLRTLDDWLGPRLSTVTGRAGLEAIDVAAALRRLVPPGAHHDLDRLAPAQLTLPGGRRVRVDYAEEPPVVAVRVQDVFGMDTTPVLAGGVRPVFHLLSPAGRPVQITSDLAGFWSGSWRDVRKEMAGRYPKHPWPEDPSAG